MYIEDLDEVYLMLNVERLKCIRDLQKGILRRQSRFKRILSIYMKLYKMLNNSNDLDEDEENFEKDRFNEYHSLLQRIIANHLKDLDEMEEQLEHQVGLETQNQGAILQTRQDLSATQHKLSGVFRREDKISKTLQASNAPNKAYVGFMENVLSGMRDPDEEINYEEYSTYCQVKWTLESVDMEYFDLAHTLFDCQMESNELTDEALDQIDQSVISSLPINELLRDDDDQASSFSKDYKNLYNVYGFDGFGQFEQWDDDFLLPEIETPDTPVSDIQTLESKGNPDTRISNDRVEGDLINNQSWDLQILNTPVPDVQIPDTDKDWTKEVAGEKGVDDVVEYVIDNIDFTEDHFMMEASDDRSFLRIGGDKIKASVENRFSAYLRESTSTVTENDIEDVPISELDFDLFVSSSVENEIISPLSSPPKYTSSEIFVEGELQEEQHNSIARSSCVLTKQNKEDSLKRLSSGSSTSSDTVNIAASRRMTSSSSVSSTGSKDSKSGKRRINARRGKLVGNSDKDLFFLPPEDFDDDLIGYNKNKNNNNNTIPSITTSMETESPQKPNSNNNSNNNNKSGHTKLRRLIGTLSKERQRNHDNGIIMTSSPSSSKGKLTTNIQNIVVDGRHLKVGDLTPYSMDRLSIKNRPRKLSIVRNRDK